MGLRTRVDVLSVVVNIAGSDEEASSQETNRLGTYLDDTRALLMPRKGKQRERVLSTSCTI